MPADQAEPGTGEGALQQGMAAGPCEAQAAASTEAAGDNGAKQERAIAPTPLASVDCSHLLKCPLVPMLPGIKAIRTAHFCMWRCLPFDVVLTDAGAALSH